MISMTGCTGRRTQVASYRKRFVVDAGAVLCELVCGDGVSLHVIRVSMAASACVRHVDRIHRRTWIAGGPQVVDTMTIRAHCNFGVTGSQAFTVHTGVILVQLVCPQTGVELPHVGWVGMATSTQLRDLLAIYLALPPGLAAHGFVGIVAGGIAPVTAGARQSLLCMYVLTELLLAHSDWIRQRGVAIQAGVGGLSKNQRCTKSDNAEQR